MSHELVETVIKDRLGGLWFTTWNGVSFLAPDSERFVSYLLPTGDWGGWNNFHAACQDHQGVFWFGSEKGIARYDGASWTYGIGQTYQPLTWAVRAIAEDRDGNLWFGTDGGICRLDRSRTHWTDLTDSLQAQTVFSP